MNEKQKTSKWQYFFYLISALQILGVVFFFAMLWWAIKKAKTGMSGTEFIALWLYMTVVPAVGLIALINVIGLPIYLITKKPRGKSLIFNFVSLVLSLVIALYVAYAVYQTYVVTPARLQEQSEQSRIVSEQEDQTFAAENQKPEITKEEAINLLTTCQLRGFYYTNQTRPEELGDIRFPAAEASTTGIVLVKVDGKPYRISIADRHIPELVPIARKAQKTCPDLQFWHDDAYEQYENGAWYFKGNPVTDDR